MKRFVHLACVAAMLFASSKATALPDLVISNFNATVVDRSATFSAELCNVGPDNATPLIYLARWNDLASAPSCGMVPDGSSQIYNNLKGYSVAAGACGPIGFELHGLPTGSHTAWLMADQTCAATESDETNNTAAAPYTIAEPDMWIKDFTVTVNGTTVDASYEFCNKGTTAITSFFVGLYTDRPAAPSCNDAPDYGVMFPVASSTGVSFAAGTCSQSSGSFPITAGNHTAWLFIDHDCTLPESARSDNIKSAAYVLAAPDAGVDAAPDAGVDAAPDQGAPDLPASDGSQCNFDGTCDAGEACPCPDCCTCDNPVTAGASTTLTGEFETLVDCPPIFKGKAGVEVAISGSASGQVAGCPDCKAEFKTSASLAATLHMCEVKFSVEGGGEYNWTKQHCVGCDPVTCEKKCLDTFCMQESSTLQAKLGISRFFGFKVGSTKGPIGAEFQCGVEAGGSFGGKVTDETTEDGGCAPCQQCSKMAGELTLGLNATGSCGLTVKVGSWEPQIGCNDCVTLGVDFTGGASVQSGECGDKDCAHGKISANAGFSIKKCIDVLWFQVGIGCTGKATGECSKDTCGGGGCKSNTELSCAVTGTRGECETEEKWRQ